MSIISEWKRRCDKAIGGCGRTNVDIDDVVTVARGKVHLCKTCAGRIVLKQLDGLFLQKLIREG